VEVPILETCTVSDARLRYIDCIVPMARRVYGRVAAARDAGRFPLVLGGDHSLSLGSVRGAARRRPVGVIWVDAHADFNTAETTPSGNIHGMPLAALAGYGDPRLVHLGTETAQAVEPAHIAIVGVRLLDPGERVLLKQAGVNVFSMEQIDRLGLYAATQQAIEVATRDTEGIYLSLDLDALDPLYAPGVGTPEDGGLSYREAHTVCELIADTGKLLGMDVVEVNPILDERNRTAHLAVELVQSALGLRVWRE
jgi:arginase